MPGVSLKRGKIVHLRTGEYATFMYNPTVQELNRTVTFARVTPAGASHSIAQFVSGGDDTISLDFYLDGDRGLLGRSGRRPSNEHRQRGVGRDVSVQDDIDWFYSLTLGSPIGGRFFEDVSPSLVVLDYGTLFANAVCTVDQVQIKAKELRHYDLAPIRATVGVRFNRQPSQTEVRSDVFRYRGFRAPTRRI